MVNNFLLLAVVILYILTIDSDKLKVNHSQTKSDISQILSFSKWAVCVHADKSYSGVSWLRNIIWITNRPQKLAGSSTRSTLLIINSACHCVDICFQNEIEIENKNIITELIQKLQKLMIMMMLFSWLSLDPVFLSFGLFWVIPEHSGKWPGPTFCIHHKPLVQFPFCCYSRSEILWHSHDDVSLPNTGKLLKLEEVWQKVMDGNHYLLKKKSCTHERWRPLNAFSNTLQRDVTVHDSVVLGKRKLADVHLNPNILNHLFKARVLLQQRHDHSWGDYSF